jgi:NAD-dependent dihydropyrimidine dehydrogenase PreA subunit
MNFPCKNCIVDAICIETCPNLKAYLSVRSSLDRGYDITTARLKRLSTLAATSVFFRNHYTNAYKRFMKEKNGTSM